MKKIIISHIGLLERDMVLLKNLSHLSATWFGNFELAEEPNTPDGQILIVDIDSEVSRQTWYQLKSTSWFDKTIVISRSKHHVQGADVQLSRPLIFRRVADALQKVVEAKSNKDETSNQRKILVVDDSNAVRTFMHQKLAEFLDKSISVDSADSGEDGIIKSQDFKYDLIFMDVMMPGMDGYQACKMIKKHSTSKVVMLTSKSSTINKVKAKISGCDGYITKPPKDQDLINVIRRHLGEDATDNHLMPNMAALGR